MKTKFAVTYILPKDSDKKELGVVIFQKEPNEKMWYSAGNSSSYCSDSDINRNSFGENIFISFNKAEHAYNLLRVLNKFQDRN